MRGRQNLKTTVVITDSVLFDSLKMWEYLFNIPQGARRLFVPLWVYLVSIPNKVQQGGAVAPL